MWGIFTFVCRNEGGLQALEKRLSTGLEAFFESVGAIAIAASPEFRAILMSAIAARVGILDTDQLKKLLPVGAFLLQRCGAVTDLNPHSRTVLLEAGMFHVVEIFITGNRSPAQRAFFDGLCKGPFASAFDPRFDKVAHSLKIHETGFGETRA